MKRKIHIVIISIPILLLITLSPILSANNNTLNSSNESQNMTNASSSIGKVAFIIPHPDDETIGAGGTIGKLIANGTRIHFELMASGDGQGTTLLNVTNYYNVDIPTNSSASYKKKLIREDSFKRVMAIYGCDDYNMQGYDDGTLTAAQVFSTMENLYLNQGCTVFYTVTGDGNSDHMACYQAMLMMEMKYPNLEYRQFPIYYYHTSRPTSLALTNNSTDEDVSQYTSKKLSAFQVYYNINTIRPIFYPYSDGLYSSSPERIYYIN